MGAGYRTREIAGELIARGWASPARAARLLARNRFDREAIEAVKGPGRPPSPGRLLWRSADSNGGSWGLGSLEIPNDLAGDLASLAGGESVGGQTDRGLYFRAYWISEALCLRVERDPEGVRREAAQRQAENEARQQAENEARDAARRTLQAHAAHAAALEERARVVRDRLPYGSDAQQAATVVLDRAALAACCADRARRALPGVYSHLTTEERQEAIADELAAWASCPTESEIAALEAL